MPVRISPLLSAGLLAGAALAMPMSHAEAPTVNAAPVRDFLDSIGANSAVAARGESLARTAECVKFVGLGWIRGGYEGDVPTDQLIALHQQTGVRYSYGLGSGGSDIIRLLDGARKLAAVGALVAIEGPNEPNNWGVTYQAEEGGGHAKTWMAVAKLQRDLYAAVKSDPVLKGYPVWSISENGAESDNVGLQFLKIPAGANCLMPDGTTYADCANVHNYVYHSNSPHVEDNKTWNASDPTPACRVDGIYGNYGTTWGKHFAGYSVDELKTLPRVTTETGTTIGGEVTEDIHGLNVLSLYLDQFKRGWNHTSLYILRDRVDEGGNQKFGMYAPDYTPRKAAVYLHNLTTILADPGTARGSGALAYSIPDEPATVHDMLLQKSDGTFALIVWGEKVSGSDPVTVQFGGTQRSVTVFDPTLGTDATQKLTGVSSASLTLSDHPLVLLLPGRGGRRGR